MTESPDSLDEIKRIRYRLDSIDTSQDLLIRASKKKFLDDLIPEFKKSKERSIVYLAVDGKRSVGELSAITKILVPNVSRQVSWLKDNCLIEVNSGLSGNKIVYKKTRLDRNIGLTRELKKLGFAEPRVEESAQEASVDKSQLDTNAKDEQDGTSITA